MSWLKENWFRIGILLVVLTIGIITYLQQPQPQPTSITYYTSLEIEKCKAKLESGLSSQQLEGVVNFINSIYQPKFNEERSKLQEISQLVEDCIDEYLSRGEPSCESYQVLLDNHNKRWNQLKKEEEEMFKDLIEGIQQKNYRECLDMIK